MVRQTVLRTTFARLAGAATVACLALAAFTHPTRAADAAAAKEVDFKKDIQPILNQSCMKCHKPDPKNPRGPAAGFRLDDKAAAMKGGKHGVAIVPGKADESLFYKLLAGPVTVDRGFLSVTDEGTHRRLRVLKVYRVENLKTAPSFACQLWAMQVALSGWWCP